MKAVFVSPHLDDAVFSAGGTIARLVRSGLDVTVATVFTRSVPGPTGFALACQTDKGIAPDIDYMALRRAEDLEACARLGAGARWIDLPEAPHRGYANASALFGPRRADDPLAPVVAAVRGLIAGADLVAAPLCLGHHVDHHLVVDAIDGLAPRARIAWEDMPYALRLDTEARGRLPSPSRWNRSTSPPSSTPLRRTRRSSGSSSAESQQCGARWRTRPSDTVAASGSP